MGLIMNEKLENNSSGILQIKELKEKVRSLVSEVDLDRVNFKLKHEGALECDLNSSASEIGEDEDEFIDCPEVELLDENNWLTKENVREEPLQQVYKKVYSSIENDRPDITSLCLELESLRGNTHFGFNAQNASIDSRTFTRPKKFSTRTPINSAEDGRPKLQRRLTTTISPTPNLISKLEELSKTNNRPVSGNYSDVNWQDGSAEGLADVGKPSRRPGRQSLPASLYDRLQELKKANSSYITSKMPEARLSVEKSIDRTGCAMMEDAKKVKAALDVHLRTGQVSSPFSEIFRNTQDYFSDDNESFISLDEVSGFCDRLTLSTDQATYSSIFEEMEQKDICLFHRTFSENKPADKRLTFGGLEIPSEDFPKNISLDQTRVIEEENELNRTFEIESEELTENRNRFEGGSELEKHEFMNLTYDAEIKPGLVDTMLRSDVIKIISPNRHLKTENSLNNNLNRSLKTKNNNSNSHINDMNISNNNNNINSNNNNNINCSTNSSISGDEKESRSRTMSPCAGSSALNATYEKIKENTNESGINVIHTSKYSTKVFDSSFKKIGSTRKVNGKKEASSDQSEDDCMSTTSDNSNRSLESNPDPRPINNFRHHAATQHNKKLSSTPITTQRSKLSFEAVSPIMMEVGDGEPGPHSNPSSRGQSPRRSAIPHQDGFQKTRMPTIRQPLKVPQRELKLKPALVRPTHNFKRPLSYARTSSEPSVPEKVESCQPAASVPALSSGPAQTPSLTNVKSSNRTSGIPRPPTRLKQPQIRLNYGKK